MYHEHPLRIMRYSAKNIWLLIFPLIRGIKTVRLDTDRLYAWLKGSWFDIAVIGVILVFGYVRWYFSGIEINEDSIVRWEGVFAKFHTTMPYKNVSSVTVEKPFHLVPLGAVRVNCDTSSGFFRSADMKLLVSTKVCSEILKKIPDVDPESRVKDIPETNQLSILIFSLFFSSGFSGMVYIATFFFKGGDIAHDIINVSLDKITAQTEKITDKLLMHIPSVALGAGVFFITAWFLSFIVNFMRYAKFSVEADRYCLKVSCGLFNRREYRITASHVNYTDLRQNIVMKILGIVAVHVSCAGYGSSKNHLPVLMPVKREKNLDKTLGRIGVKARLENDFRPVIKGLWQYIWQPVISCIALFPLNTVFSRLIPDASDLTLFFAVMFEIPSVWLILVNIVSFFTSGVSVYDDKILIRCSKTTAFHTVIAERKKLVKLELQQTLPQKIDGRCNLVFWFGSEEKAHFKVKALSVKSALEIAEVLDYNFN